ncbi:12928_t:CDS:2 [Acaulospora morrowiae]|uniref:Dynactin subunit 4 n=1 Tax=Acaulospora morrowiae TaxID=94023 RepID=A0A9N8ZZ61_9GLOM|nr:12928_t:CDS:2 [Acaulospora morrowiae]
MSSSSTQVLDARQLAYVHYHCSCPDVCKSNESSEKSIPDFDVNSPRVQFSTFPISKLYFCDDCHQIRCPRCVQEEIVCFYCPNCLFEVPTASVKSERNRCARNCFQCPICQNTLSVVASSEPPLANPPAALNMTPTGAPYFLSCGVCRWDSQEIGMTFEKATGLALQLQKTEDERPDVKEFDHLKEHFEKHLRLNIPSTSLPSSLSSIPGMSSFTSRYGGSSMAHTQQKSDDVAPYEAVGKVESESGLVDDLVQLKDVNQITTLAQRMNQHSDQPYKRIHLRTKRVKRCRSCRHILIKPEQKAQATRFKIKLVALNSIPKITITSLPKLILNQQTQIVLKFSNPLYEEIMVELKLNDEPLEYGKITIPSPHFNITPYNEVWEYDEQELVPSKSRPQSSASIAPRNDIIGIYERRGNYTSIIVEITPLSEVEEFKFPLLVTYTTKSNDVNDGNENPENPSDVPPTNKSEDSKVEADKTDTSTSTNLTTRSLSFWTIIGLGSVVKAPVPSRSSTHGNSGAVRPNSISGKS